MKVLSLISTVLHGRTRQVCTLAVAILAESKVRSRRMSSSAHSASTSARQQHYDLVVIGGGSGGLAAAKRSAEYGAKVAIIEASRWGGTCVNVGCVPKKIMYNTAHIAEVLRHDAQQFGFNISDTSQPITFNWSGAKTARDNYIARLNSIYEAGLSKLDIDRISGFASFPPQENHPDSTRIHVDGVDGTDNFASLSAKHVVIAVGGTPSTLGSTPGSELCIDSNGFFALEKQPRKVAIIGAGYIAVELAGVLNALGSDVTLIVRGANALRKFDTMLQASLDSSLKSAGVKVMSNSSTKEIKQLPDGTCAIYLQSGATLDGFDVIINATGRRPLTEALSLAHMGLEVDRRGYLKVDEYQNTTRRNVYALGDCAGKVELTPMAIAAGRRLGDRLFGPPEFKNAKADYDNVPTVVFSHPPIGTVGLTEEEAVTKYGRDHVVVYTSNFVNLYYAPFYNGGVGEKPVSRYKMITLLPSERVLGVHLIGAGSDEALQGFALAIKMGATKSDFDSVIAIHPTAAEELVTMPPWGKSPSSNK